MIKIHAKTICIVQGYSRNSSNESSFFKSEIVLEVI